MSEAPGPLSLIFQRSTRLGETLISTDFSAGSSVAPIDRDELGTLPGPTSERWQEPATVFDLAGVEVKACGHLLDDECDVDCDEFVAEARRVFERPIMCRPASQWGAA